MSNTHIRITNGTKVKMDRIKKDFGFKTYDEIINELIEFQENYNQKNIESIAYKKILKEVENVKYTLNQLCHGLDERHVLPKDIPRNKHIYMEQGEDIRVNKIKQNNMNKGR